MRTYVKITIIDHIHYIVAQEREDTPKEWKLKTKHTKAFQAIPSDLTKFLKKAHNRDVCGKGRYDISTWKWVA